MEELLLRLDFARVQVESSADGVSSAILRSFPVDGDVVELREVFGVP